MAIGDSLFGEFVEKNQVRNNILILSRIFYVNREYYLYTSIEGG
ncbi:hypothetical protein SAMN05443529_103235 [Desulfosporosinus hippei DSM 8344]|uniref:Uncharacterized protein n=1 Tax=Desulfosporosinus hippei DSM 8344 TaxID=1121419 RepID=A0A1G7USG0_9FIRM|nr:hypothetical protein SAMN05443529_103235 [Desulfosporosinus hippei DSM 8344]